MGLGPGTSQASRALPEQTRTPPLASRFSSVPQRQTSRERPPARPWRLPTALLELPRFALDSSVAVSASRSRERSKENLVASTAGSCAPRAATSIEVASRWDQPRAISSLLTPPRPAVNHGSPRTVTRRWTSRMAVDHSSPRAKSGGRIPGSVTLASTVTSSLTVLQSPGNTGLGCPL